MNSDSLNRAITRGLVGGFVATVIMDLTCAAFFAGVGTPVDLTYSFIGKVSGNFFTLIGIDLPGSRLLGAVVHFALGIGLGGLFGAAVSRIRALRVDVAKTAVLLGILYTEIVSQPIVASAPLLENMSSSGILQWYALSTGMHLVYGVILGLILAGRRKATVSTSYAI